MPPKCWEKYLSTCNCVPRKTVFQEWEWIKPCADKNSVYCQELHTQGTSKVCTLRKKRNPERWLGTRRNDDIWGNKRKRVNGKDIYFRFWLFSMQKYYVYLFFLKIESYCKCYFVSCFLNFPINIIMNTCHVRNIFYRKHYK